MTRAPLRIAFAANSYLDPRKPISWSGLPHFIRRSFELAGLEVETCILPEPNRVGTTLRYGYWRFLRGRRYLRSFEPRLLKHYARQIGRSALSLKVDAVFSPSSLPVAYLRTDIPTVFWTDACFAGMVNFYESFTNLAATSVVDGHAAERAALKNCAMAIYSSAWAAETARECYSADPSKIRIVPFGGNVPERPSICDVEAFVAQRDLRRCELLLLGVDWRRKGAEIAVEAVKSLSERGIPSRLTIVGCVPPRSFSLPPCVEVIRFISKSTNEGWRQFKEICRRSHFLLMPARADCAPIAIVEGNYFGLPCLATGVGGIPSLVCDEVNGHIFSLKARGAAYADYIAGLMRDPFRYRSLAVGSAMHAGRNFTWEASGATVAAIIREVVEMKSAAQAPFSSRVATGR